VKLLTFVTRNKKLLNFRLISKGMMSAEADRIGYCRISLNEINFSSLPNWFTLSTDPLMIHAQPTTVPTPAQDDKAASGTKDSVADVKSEVKAIAGFVHLAINFGLVEDCPGARKEIRKMTVKKYELRAHIYQARESNHCFHLSFNQMFQQCSFHLLNNNYDYITNATFLFFSFLFFSGSTFSSGIRFRLL
jgi:hypothetical protein